MPTLQMRNEELKLRNLPRIKLRSQDWTTGFWTPKLALLTKMLALLLVKYKIYGKLLWSLS